VVGKQQHVSRNKNKMLIRKTPHLTLGSFTYALDKTPKKSAQCLNNRPRRHYGKKIIAAKLGLHWKVS